MTCINWMVLKIYGRASFYPGHLLEKGSERKGERLLCLVRELKHKCVFSYLLASLSAILTFFGFQLCGGVPGGDLDV